MSALPGAARGSLAVGSHPGEGRRKGALDEGPETWFPLKEEVLQGMGRGGRVITTSFLLSSGHQARHLFLGGPWPLAPCGLGASEGELGRSRAPHLLDVGRVRGSSGWTPAVDYPTPTRNVSFDSGISCQLPPGLAGQRGAGGRRDGSKYLARSGPRALGSGGFPGTATRGDGPRRPAAGK